jgi:dipeptidyl aminopeptidase/acylaminoacyl peptidase
MLFKHLPFRALVAAAACTFLATTVAAQGAAQTPVKPPVEVFFQNPAFSGGKLSPSARYVAVGVAPKDGRTQLMVIDVEKLTAKMVAGYSDADVADFQWVNDERLVYSVVDRQLAPADRDRYPGIQVVSRDGTGFDEVMTRQRPWWLHSTTRAKNSEDVFIAARAGDSGVFFQRINTRTRKVVDAAAEKGVVDWLFDADDKTSIRVMREGSHDAVQYLDPQEKKWQRLGDYGHFVPTGMVPLGLGSDDDLFVIARNGRDKQALYRYDLKKRALDAEPLVSLAENDFDGVAVFGKRGILGVRYVSDAEATLWFDPELKEVQAKVDALLPGRINRIEIAARPEIPYVAVISHSDVDPGNYYLFNTQTAKLTHLGAAMRGIEPRQMARRDLVRYKARDGLDIPAWLTLPSSGARKNLPLVVLVHEGPWSRSASWQWDAPSQFLASRGYAVLEPEFRGGTGWGFKHYQAGWRQWGLAMQHDLADGVRWAVSQGIVDGGKVCIAGGAYGGYAALMGLANDPDVYRCGLSWGGITDLTSINSLDWEVGLVQSSVYRTRGLKAEVADGEKDVAQLKALSPLQYADRIKQPVFLAHGGANRVVGIDQSIKFRNALRRHNPNVEWVEYLEEGHTWVAVKNRVDFWTRVEKFLEKNIGR